MNAQQSHRLKLVGIQAIQAALTVEAEKRPGRAFEEWIEAEAKAVWAATRDYAQQHSLRVPTLEEVVSVERQARGHIDYSLKWALYAVELTLIAQPAAITA